MTRWWPLPTLVVAKLDHVPDDPFFVVPTTHYYYFWNLNGDSLLCHSLLVDRIHPCFVNSIGQSSPRSSSSFLVGSKISDREDPCMVHDSTMGDGEEVVISIGRPDFVAAAAAWCGHYSDDDDGRRHWSSSDPPVVPCATGVPLSTTTTTTTVVIDVVRSVVSVSWLYYYCDQSS